MLDQVIRSTESGVTCQRWMEAGDFLAQVSLYSVLSVLTSEVLMRCICTPYSFSMERVLAKLSSASSQSGQAHPARSYLGFVYLISRRSVSVPHFYHTHHNRQNSFLIIFEQFEASPRLFAFPFCLPISIAFIDQHASSQQSPRHCPLIATMLLDPVLRLYTSRNCPS